MAMAGTELSKAMREIRGQFYSFDLEAWELTGSSS